MRYSLLVLIPLLASLAAAQTASQSDWSGGPGTPGPVLSWGDDFSMDTGPAWFGTPGSVGIAMGVEHAVDLSFLSAQSVYSDDIDGDGDIDVLGAANINDDIGWWENTDGLGIVWIEHMVDWNFNGAQSVCSDDIDGDGDIDVLGAAVNANDIAWWENVDGLGTVWVEHMVDGYFNGAQSVCSDDIDGDGDIDVLGAASIANSISWWENDDGLGTVWIEHPVDVEFDGAHSVCSDDIDGDGDIDVLGAASSANSISWWENVDGLGSVWIEHPVDVEFDGAHSVCSDDIDGDGDIDVLGASSNANSISWWENVDGLGAVWIEHSIDAEFDGASSIRSDDIDSDGDIDVLGASFDDGDITWWENADGLGNSWTEHLVDGGFTGAHSVCSDDFDGDGSIDVLGAASIAYDIAWWDLNAYISNASLESSILYTGCDPDWGTLLWSSQTPPGTAVSFQVRASDNYSQMGSWSDALAAPYSLHGILVDNASYIQYRAFLTTANPDTTPTLLDVTVTWNSLGAGEGEWPPALELLPFSPNPTFGSIVLSFGLPSATVAGFSVFDVSGRVVAQEPAAQYPAGYQQIQLGELPPGVYICQMRAGSFTATQRFAVVE